jgi:hypothetical protein
MSFVLLMKPLAKLYLVLQQEQKFIDNQLHTLDCSLSQQALL